MTNEHNCPLSPFCKVAGVEGVCTEQCGAFISVMSRYKVSGVPRGYSDVFLDNSPAREDQADIYAILDEYVRTFTKDDVRVKNLYLYGRQVGVGKTTAATAVLNEYIRRRFMYYTSRREAVPEVLAMFLDLNQMHRRYNMASMANDDEEISNIFSEIKRASTVEMLVVDDIGVRSSSESFRSIVHSIVNERISNELVTVYTSNVSMGELESVFDSRVYDRVRDMTLELTFGGESRRGRR